MFNDNKNSERVIYLLHHYKKMERTEAYRQIDILMEELKASRDDLRLLFYIGVDCDHDAYEHGLTHVKDFAKDNNPDNLYRCEQFVKALNTFVPESKAEHRAYLLQRFLAVTGYTP